MSDTTSKSDMVKTGLFQEMSYLHGSGYDTPPRSAEYLDHRGRGMVMQGSKSRTATNEGYFMKFSRIFEGEAYTDNAKQRRLERIESAKHNIAKEPFLSLTSTKSGNGAGTYYGAFSGPMPAFSPLTRKRRPSTPVGPNIKIGPPKKGTGYGYVDVTIGKYPPHILPEQEERLARSRPKESSEKKITTPFWVGMHPKEYFTPFPSDPIPHVPRKRSKFAGTPFRPASPGKKMGGMKAGCFSKYPEYMSEPFKEFEYNRYSIFGSPIRKVFKALPGPKSSLTKSNINYNVDRVPYARSFSASTQSQTGSSHL